MKGNISLKKFIQQVKDELVEAQDKTGEPFYELENVELEVSFALSGSAGAKKKLIVFDLDAKVEGKQTHKVKLSFKPLKKQSRSEEKAPSSGGGDDGTIGLGSIMGGGYPVYDKVKDV